MLMRECNRNWVWNQYVVCDEGNGPCDTVRRERDDGLYQPITYLAFKISEEITVTLLHSLPVSVMIYYTVQLKVRQPMRACQKPLGVLTSTCLSTHNSTVFGTVACTSCMSCRPLYCPHAMSEEPCLTSAKLCRCYRQRTA